MRTKFNSQEIIAINNFSDKFHECINKHDFGFDNEETTSISIENEDYRDDYVIIHFWDAKIILELSTKGWKRGLEYQIHNQYSDDDQNIFLIHFSYRKQPRLENIVVYDSICYSIEEALGEILKIVDTYVSNKSAINLVDNLFIEKFNSIELNKIEILKSEIENIVRGESPEDELDCRFEIRDDNYLLIYLMTGCIEMSLDRAKSNGMRLFVVENTFMGESYDRYRNSLRCHSIYRGGEELDRTEDRLREVYFHTSMPMAIREILSCLGLHINFYIVEYF